VRAAAQSTPPQLQASAWILVDRRDGEVLASHAPARRLSIASTTKLMTAHLALQALPLRKRVPMAPYEALPVESVLGIPAGTRISVRDLLYSLVLQSGNDSAETLAVQVAGSVPAFVGRMNRSAGALGLFETHYANPIGLDSPGNYSSARDLAALAGRLLDNRTFARISDTPSALLGSLSPPLRISTRNTLLLSEPWVTGVKTGHTLDAGYVLVGSAKRRGTELISVVLGAPSESQRDTESLELLDYGFSQYRVRHPVRAREAVAMPSIRYQDGGLDLRAAHPISVGVRRGERLQTLVRAPDEVTGPVRRGKRLGSVRVTVDGRPAGGAALVASRAIPEATALEKLRSRPLLVASLIAAAAFAILLCVLLVRRRDGGGSQSEEEMRSNREMRRRARDHRRNSGESGR
jgi:serine-type D-Ala-D-Ala carboxypeptidase (penicillin-binding protein 5/6)